MYRRDVFKGDRRAEWDDWSRHVQFDPTLSDAEKKAFHDIFAAEGGMKRAPGGTAVAGILQGTLNEVGTRIPLVVSKHGGVKNLKTQNLDHEDIKEIYKGIFDQHFEKVSQKWNTDKKIETFRGLNMLGVIGDDKLSSAVADIVFRDGIGSAGIIVQRAVAKVNSTKNPSLDGILGTKTFEDLQDIAKNKEKMRIFLDNAAAQRRSNEKDRNDYFRFLD